MISVCCVTVTADADAVTLMMMLNSLLFQGFSLQIVEPLFDDNEIWINPSLSTLSYASFICSKCILITSNMLLFSHIQIKSYFPMFGAHHHKILTTTHPNIHHKIDYFIHIHLHYYSYILLNNGIYTHRHIHIYFDILLEHSIYFMSI